MAFPFAGPATTLCAISRSYLVRFAIGRDETLCKTSSQVGFVKESARVFELDEFPRVTTRNRLQDFAPGHDFIIHGCRRSGRVKSCSYAVCRKAGVPDAEDDPYVRSFWCVDNRQPRQLLFDQCDDCFLVV